MAHQLMLMTIKIRIGTLNTAGLKSLNRLPYAVNRIVESKIDILCMQECTEQEKGKYYKKVKQYEFIWNDKTAICFNVVE